MSQNSTMPTISIKGVSYPCRITMGAMLRFKRTTGKDVTDLDEKNLADLVAFVWSCTSSACSADGVNFDLSVDQFADCLEPQGLQSFTNYMDTQKKTMPTLTK